MPTRRWIVIRVDDNAKRGTYETKMEALTAAGRFCADGCGYEVIEELMPDVKAAEIVLPGQSHKR